MVLYFLASLAGSTTARQVLAGAGLPLALATAVYTAYLFAQAKARDLWQSPLLAPHLAVQAVLAGAAAVLPLAAWLAPGRAVSAVEVVAGCRRSGACAAGGRRDDPAARDRARPPGHPGDDPAAARLVLLARPGPGGGWPLPLPGSGWRPARSRWPGCSPTSTPTSRPASPSRSREELAAMPDRADHDRRAGRPGRTGVRRAVSGGSPRRDVLPGAQPHPAGRVSAEGALGRLGRARLPGVAEAARSTTTCWCPPRASTASRRAGCSPTWTVRAGRSASSKATPSTPARAAATAPRARPPSTR